MAHAGVSSEASGEEGASSPQTMPTRKSPSPDEKAACIEIWPGTLRKSHIRGFIVSLRGAKDGQLGEALLDWGLKPSLGVFSHAGGLFQEIVDIAAMGIVAINTEHAATDNFVVHASCEPLFFVTLKTNGFKAHP